MTATELRALREKLLLVQPLFADDQPALEDAAEVLELLAWQADHRVGVGPGWTDAGWICEVSGEQYEGDTIISTLRRAREVERGDKKGNKNDCQTENNKCIG